MRAVDFGHEDIRKSLRIYERDPANEPSLQMESIVNIEDHDMPQSHYGASKRWLGDKSMSMRDSRIELIEDSANIEDNSIRSKHGRSKLNFSRKINDSQTHHLQKQQNARISSYGDDSENIQPSIVLRDDVEAENEEVEDSHIGVNHGRPNVAQSKGHGKNLQISAAISHTSNQDFIQMENQNGLAASNLVRSAQRQTFNQQDQIYMLTQREVDCWEL